MPKLTKRTVDSLKSEAREYTVWDTALPGFGCRVWPSGKRTFILKYRVAGGRSGTVRKPTIGRLGAITVEEARARGSS